MALPPNVDGEISSVQDLLNFTRDKKLVEKPDYHLRWWFRGQPDAGCDLRPGVYRPGFVAVKANKAEEEAARQKLERQLMQDFRVESAGILRGDETEAELYFLQQHYGMPTRLLDWTTNPLAALFFAAAEKKDDKGTLLDGKVFMIDTYKCTTGKYAAADGTERDFIGVASSRHPAFEVALHRISRWDDKKSFPKFIIPVRPDHRDRRIAAQRSRFTFHVPDHPVLDKAENSSLLRLLVRSGAKKTILDQLFLLGIDDHTIYGDLESLAKRLRAAYKITTPARRP